MCSSVATCQDEMAQIVPHVYHLNLLRRIMTANPYNTLPDLA